MTISEIKDALQSFIAALNRFDLEVVAVFDGLDRLIQPDKFWAIVDQDLRALRTMSISVLITGPISVLYGAGRSISDQFEKVHHLAAIATDDLHLGSLYSLLNKRGSSLLLDSDLAARICHASGGVLRDLVALARDAAEDAYVAGSTMIQNENVERVIAQLGTAYRRGLGRAQIDVLNELTETGGFDPSITRNVELLVTRRVLEYSATEFRVHPALIPLI